MDALLQALLQSPNRTFLALCVSVGLVFYAREFRRLRMHAALERAVAMRAEVRDPGLCDECRARPSVGLVTRCCHRWFCLECLKGLPSEPQNNGRLQCCVAGEGANELAPAGPVNRCDPRLLTYVKDPFGRAYVQLSRIGLASYHFFPQGGSSYIYYKDTPWLLDNNEPPPERKYFLRASYNPTTRTFRGELEWQVGFHGDRTWEYEIVFRDDFLIIESGRVLATDRDGQTSVTHYMNRSHRFALFYALYTDKDLLVARARIVVCLNLLLHARRTRTSKFFGMPVDIIRALATMLAR